jgi:hypothetical protein
VERMASVRLDCYLAPMRWLLSLSLIGITLASVGPASAQDCSPSSPAFPVPATLRPDALRPAPTPRPNDQLPDNRDSTDS